MQQVMAFAVQGQSGSYELEPQVIPPLITRAELEKTVRLRTSIATAIDKSSTDERNHNIRLSFSKFNGMILKPGQTSVLTRWWDHARLKTALPKRLNTLMVIL